MTRPMTRRAVLGHAAGGAALLSATTASLAERLAAAGRRRAERFSWDETAARTAEVYEQVLESK